MFFYLIKGEEQLRLTFGWQDVQRTDETTKTGQNIRSRTIFCLQRGTLWSPRVRDSGPGPGAYGIQKSADEAHILRLRRVVLALRGRGRDRAAERG